MPLGSHFTKRLACDLRSVGLQEVITIEMRRPNPGSFGADRIRDGLTTSSFGPVSFSDGLTPGT